jgi:hypothetical protein
MLSQETIQVTGSTDLQLDAINWTTCWSVTKNIIMV